MIRMNKIFGIGLSRTGTLSLARALRELGYKTSHYPKPPLMPELATTIENYDAACDTPIALAYKDLDKIFLNSKFILTTRSLESWMNSCRNFKHFRRELKGQGKQVRLSLYNYNGFSERRFRITYLRHHGNVLNYFEYRNDLLIMDITKGDGWEKLCKFLDKNIPDKPFPHKHKTKVHK